MRWFGGQPHFWQQSATDTALAETQAVPFGRPLKVAGMGVVRLAPKLRILWAQLKNPLLAVLVSAAVISLLAGKEVDAIMDSLEPGKEE